MRFGTWVSSAASFLSMFVLTSLAAAQDPTTTTTVRTDPTPVAAAEDVDLGPKTGFTMEARLSQSIAPVGIGLSASLLLPSIVGGPPPASIGYRGNGYAITVGPSLGHVGYDTSSTDSTSISYYGAAFLGEVDVVRSSNRRMEGYLLLGVNVAAASSSTSSTAPTVGTIAPTPDDGVSGKPAFGALAGFGLRYWLSPHLGIGAEMGESYLNIPIGSSASASFDSSGNLTTSSSTSLRANVLSTFGDLHVALTL